MSSFAPISLQLYCLRSDDVATFVDDRTLNRARNLFTNGGVTNGRAQGTQLFARVRDRSSRPCQVTLTLSETTMFATCTCYQGGICEHAAAVLLAWTANRSQFVFTPPDDQMAPLPIPAPDALWRGAAGESRRMATLLASQRVSDLRKLAQRVEVATDGETKETLAPKLAPFLVEGPQIATALAQATAAQHLALQGLLLYDRGASPADLERVATVVGVGGGTMDAALKGLVGLGLAFTGLPSTPTAAGWHVPSELASQIAPGPLPLATPQQFQVAASDRELGFITALRALCLLIESQPLPARPATLRSQFERQNGVLNGWNNVPEEVEKLNRRSFGIFVDEPVFLTMVTPPLAVEDGALKDLAVTLKQSEAAVALMVRLLDQLKLLETRHGMLHLAPRNALLWERSAVEQAQIVAATWANDLQWSEFHDVPGVRLRRHLQATYSVQPDRVYADLSALRRIVVRFVRALDPKLTFSVESLIDRMRRIGPTLLFRLPAGSHEQVWQVCDRHGGVLDPQQPSDWRLCVVPFVQQVLRCMQMLGLVATDADVTAVRLTGLGAHLLGLHAAYTPQPSGEVLSIGADMGVRVAAADADASLLENLDAIGERDGFVEGSFRYRLTAPAARAAFLNGRQAADVVAFLQRHHGAPLPPSVAETMLSWGASFGQVQIYDGVALLELSDDMLLPELLRSTTLSSALVCQLSPRVLVIDAARRDAVWSELVAKGYTPQRVRAISTVA